VATAKKAVVKKAANKATSKLDNGVEIVKSSTISILPETERTENYSVQYYEDADSSYDDYFDSDEFYSLDKAKSRAKEVVDTRAAVIARIFLLGFGIMASLAQHL